MTIAFPKLGYLFSETAKQDHDFRLRVEWAGEAYARGFEHDVYDGSACLRIGVNETTTKRRCGEAYPRPQEGNWRIELRSTHNLAFSSEAIHGKTATSKLK